MTSNPQPHLTFEQSVHSHLYRRGKSSTRYHLSDAHQSITVPNTTSITLQPNERCIGYYLNDAIMPPEVILFTTAGLHIWLGSSWKTVAYDQVKQVLSPLIHAEAVGKMRTPQTVDSFGLRLDDNQLINIPINGYGEMERLRDVWSLCKLVERIIGRF